MDEHLPVGKLPVDLLRKLVGSVHVNNSRVVLGPGVGLDCAVIDVGDKYLVLKTDPITFTAENIGWYAVNICANDIATTGANPSWFLATILLPEAQSTEKLIAQIQSQIINSCKNIGATFVGGHTEITHGIDRPILVGMMIGEVDKGKLISPRGAQAGDRILLTKGIPIEATAILAQEFRDKLSTTINEQEISNAKHFTKEPGISVLKDAKTAISSGIVHAMHDPTEGGLITALWEFAEASQLSIAVDLDKIPIYKISRKICSLLEINPLGAIASGSLLIAVPVNHVSNIRTGLQNSGIAVTEIGRFSKSIPDHQSRHPIVMYKIDDKFKTLPQIEKDEITKLF